MKRSFTINLEDVPYSVRFREFKENKVVVCEIFWNMPELGIWGMKSKGVAKCNPEDVWSSKEGQKIAYNKAIEKMINKIFKATKSFERYLKRKTQQIEKSLDIKFESFQRKNEKKK